MITSLKIRADRAEYSRLEPARSVLNLRVVSDDAGPVTVEITRNGVVLATEEIAAVALVGGTASFDLKVIADDGFPLFTTGEYEVVATSGEVTASTPFIVSILTAECLKTSYCAGLPLKQTDIITAVKQPSLITGVTIGQSSNGTMPGIYLLTFTAAIAADAEADPPILASPATLRWNNGAVVEVSDFPGSEILPDDRGDYIEVDIDPFNFPDAAAAEGIILDYAKIDDATIRQEIRNAVAEIERCIGTFLEPKRAATAPYYDSTYDILVQAAHFYRREAFSQSSLSWRINLPYTHVQQMSILEGYFGGNKVLELSHGVFAINHNAGSVEILPQAAELSYIITFFTQLNYWGIRESITDFWRYKAIIGLRDVGAKADLLKAVGYVAAIPILTVAGQAARGGRQSESMSKDGVSRSSSFGQGGVYGATIEQNQKWLDANKGRLRQRYGGFSMAVL
jgi:hypothetical protein